MTLEQLYNFPSDSDAILKDKIGQYQTKTKWKLAFLLIWIKFNYSMDK